MANRSGEEVERLRPALSAIVISVNDERTIERSLRALVSQELEEPFEIIVVNSGNDATAAIVRDRFPNVRLRVLDGPALPGKARNAGLEWARGDIVTFPGSHVELVPGSLAARLAAHRKGYAMVTGTILNGTPTAAGWASYFLDHSLCLPGRPSTELDNAPVHCSYERSALDAAGPFPETMRAGEDTVVNERLWDLGYRALRDRDVHLYHVSRCRNLTRLLRHHFSRGRAWGRILFQRDGDTSGLKGYIRLRMAKTAGNVERWGQDLHPRYRRVRGYVYLGILSAWLGAHLQMALDRRSHRQLSS